MAGECDAACIKTIIDTGMGAEAALLYLDVASGVSLHVAATEFYARVANNVTLPAAQALNRLHLSKEQQADLAAQIDQQCYRADDFIAWARMSETERTEHEAAWTEKILGWVKDDQTFYTELAADLEKGHNEGGDA